MQQRRKSSYKTKRQVDTNVNATTCTFVHKTNGGGDDDDVEDANGLKSQNMPCLTLWKDPILYCVGVIVMRVYVMTLYPTVAGGDSGELVAESCHLGISHPPGYPLFNMLNYLVVHLPIGEQTKAWKANCFTAGNTRINPPIYSSFMIKMKYRNENEIQFKYDLLNSTYFSLGL